MIPAVEMCANPYELAADVMRSIVVTDWNEFKQLDLRESAT